MTNGRGKSDSCVVPTKSPNKAGTAAAEAMEGRRRERQIPTLTGRSGVLQG